MRRLRSHALGLAMLAVVGCSGVSSPREETVLHRETNDPGDMIASFGRRLPDPLHVVNTATFDFGWQALVVLGVTKVDVALGTFVVVGLHPAGSVKLFEVAGDRDSVRHAFAQPQLLERGDLPAAVAEDTRRIYLDRLPSPVATWSHDDDAFRFRQPYGEGELEYVFDEQAGVLVEKRYVEENGSVWTIRYRDYREQAGELYPEEIVLEHHDYGYRLTLRLKEVHS